jgi:penicillin amidase
MKIVKWLFILTIVAVAGVASVIFIYLQSSRPVYHGEVRLDGINQEVKIYHDAYGIPHIYASNEKDAYFALGYIHAQERLFQMELLRRVGAGRLSEILGPELVSTDAFFRTLGIAKSAKEASVMFFTKPNEAWQKQTLAYLKGVNAFMFQGPTPPEFKLLGIPKVNFTPEDIYLITGYMAFSFAEAFRTDPLLDKIQSKYGQEYLSALMPESLIQISGDSVAFISDSSGIQPLLEHYEQSNNSHRDHSELARLSDNIFNALPVAPWIGSNGWAIAPSKSVSGRALLANDTHIGYQQPAVWYEAHLEYPGFAIYGNYLAGMPFPLVGHNSVMGWGLTMFENDDLNFYREKISDREPGKYLYKGKWENFRTREEVIKIKNGADSIITVRETVHGPVINDVVDQLDSTITDPVAAWWTYTRFPATALKVTHDLSNAKNMSDARKASSMVNAPGLNIIYADAEGNIALWPSARLPIYPAGMNTKILLNGWTGEHDILGYYDFEQNPLIENPESGFVYSANQAPGLIDSTQYPGYYAPDNRASRISFLLNSKEKWSRDDMSDLILDAVSSVHPLNAGIILDVIGDDPVISKSPVHKKAAETLRSWKGTHALKDTASTVYYKLLSNVLEMTMQDEIGEEDYNILVNTHFIKNAYTRILQNDSSLWWDNVNTTAIKETRRDIFVAAFSSTIDSLIKSSGNMTNWTWGSIHTVEHIHPLGRKEPLDKIFNVGPFPVRGGIETINNAAFPLNASDNFKVSYGPAMRKLIDFKDGGNGKSVLPTGQSGHVRSTHYSDQAALHVSGKFRDMKMTKDEIISGSTSILTLRPR